MNAVTTATGGKHGGKWIGAAVTALGAISSIDPSTVPPSWLPYIGIASGIAYFARSMVNTANINAQQ